MKIKITFSIILTAFVFICTIALLKDRGRIGIKKKYYIINERKNSIYNIAFIGDSWANYANRYRFSQKTDSILLRQKIKSKTRSIGFCGAKSNEIYHRLFYKMPNGFKNIIQEHPNYVIVSCGINDQHGQICPECYAHNCALIIEFLRHYNIKVIIIDVPHWDIKKNYLHYSLPKRCVYYLTNLIVNHNIDVGNNFILYRNALRKELKECQLIDQVSFITYNEFLNKNLWNDSMHLNGKGYLTLAKRIGNIIQNNK